jgi:hypothetical protein
MKKFLYMALVLSTQAMHQGHKEEVPYEALCNVKYHGFLRRMSSGCFARKDLRHFPYNDFEKHFLKTPPKNVDELLQNIPQDELYPFNLKIPG